MDDPISRFYIRKKLTRLIVGYCHFHGLEEMKKTVCGVGYARGSTEWIRALEKILKKALIYLKKARIILPLEGGGLRIRFDRCRKIPPPIYSYTSEDLPKNISESSGPLLMGERMSLSFGVEALDRLIGRLPAGCLTALHGSTLCHTLSELLCVRAQLPEDEGGLESPAVFLDGGNIFNPYAVAEFARQLHLNPQEALRGVWVSRAFTCHQLVSLVTEKLPLLLDSHSAKLIVVSDAANLFYDPYMGKEELHSLFNQTVRFLFQLAREKRAVVVATLLPHPSQERRIPLTPYLLSRSNYAVRITEKGSGYTATLEKPERGRSVKWRKT